VIFTVGKRVDFVKSLRLIDAVIQGNMVFGSDPVEKVANPSCRHDKLTIGIQTELSASGVQLDYILDHPLVILYL
jgi:hypothetical protein